MGSVNVRNNKLYLDFRYMGQRCRETTLLEDTSPNRRRLRELLKRVEAEINLGKFEYQRYFPNSPKCEFFSSLEQKKVEISVDNSQSLPSFGSFAKTWMAEKEVEWRESQQITIRCTLDLYLLPHFGSKNVDSITKADILNFRSKLAKVPGRKTETLSVSRINHIMTPLRMILNEAADRYDFTSPWKNIKSLKVPKSDVQPFSLDEVMKIIRTVRPDFRNYYIVRFFTGMRTGEIDGLCWESVDFRHRIIRVTQSLVNGKLGPVKTDGSHRNIQLNQMVMDALQAQFQLTGKGKFVFCTRNGTPFNHRNITQKVWYPLLRYLHLEHRNPYQSRHTAATLWLASGESPEWIAQQMGHTSTEMLFRVYSRYVPNLTRQDGSAFEQLLMQHSGQKQIGGDL